jgi:pimeloyl-ACP methyl ester carboxylesterase
VHSFDLPCHGEGLDTSKALYCWRDQIEAGQHQMFDEFCKQLSRRISEWGYRRIQIGGISRGGYVAALCAAKDRRITEIGLWAPVTNLQALYEFDGYDVDQEQHGLMQHVGALSKKPAYIRIGADDHRVGTGFAVEFGNAIGAKIDLLDSIGHRAPDPSGEMANWLNDHW